jgi:hypothetical protein
MTDRYDTAQPQAHALMGREGCLPAPAVLCMVIEEVLSWFAEPSCVQPDHGFNTHVWSSRLTSGSYQLPNIVRPAPEASLNGKLYPPQYSA